MYRNYAMLYSRLKRHGGFILDISIEQFLAEVEKKAYRMAEIATKNQADSLDIVQDTMIKLVEKYSDKSPQEWKLLFYRILHSKIMDYFRRRKLTNSLFFWRNPHQTEENYDNDIVNASDYITPEREITGRQNIERVTSALKELSPRQQQCFLLRSWEGFSVKETAKAMNCSQGSVKTHYSRAKETLRKALDDEK